jgi:hypothetical protein
MNRLVSIGGVMVMAFVASATRSIFLAMLLKAPIISLLLQVNIMESL